MRPSMVAITAAIPCVAATSSYSHRARVITGSSWLGNDGNWSATRFTVADQAVNLFISTTLSEHWVVSIYGCNTGDTLCTSARGGVTSVASSSKWKNYGTWSLGLSYLGNSVNALYGTTEVSQTDTLTYSTLSLDDALVAAINSTDYYVGLYGLGNVKGKFGTEQVYAPFTEMVQKDGWFPSYSFGYTAGAYYRNMPSSLTLGGYDESRLPKNPNNTDLTLSRDTLIPRVLVRNIEVDAGTFTTPSNWDGHTQSLCNFTNSFQAIIDSSTPFLYLPEEIVDTMVSALNLTYNSTLDVYQVDGSLYAKLTSWRDFNFKFTVSSYDNTNSFGDPLNVNGVVNLTIPGYAFAQYVSYPYNNVLKYGDSMVAYFPIKKTYDGTFILGRTFMQEVYMLTRYDSGTFQLHQAAFPADPIGNISIQSITQPVGSVYPAPGSMVNSGKKLTKGAIAGVAIGSICGVAMIGAVIFFYLRRRATKKAQGANCDYTIVPEPPKTPIGRFMSALHISRKPKTSLESGTGTSRNVETGQIAEVSAGTDVSVLEVGAEAGNQVFEMPDTSMAVMELDSREQGDTEFSGMTNYAYEQEKIFLALQGPVPPYTPGDHADSILPPEKVTLINDLPLPSNAVYLPPNIPPALVSPNTSTWNSTNMGPVSSMGASTLRSNSNGSNRSNLSSPRFPQSRTMTTAIDADEIVCVGSLPSDIPIPGRDPMPAVSRPDPIAPACASPRRIDASSDMVHIPQVASKRYSWEDAEAAQRENV